MYVKENVYARVSAHHGEKLYVQVPPYEFCSTAIRTGTTHRSTTIHTDTTTFGYKDNAKGQHALVKNCTYKDYALIIII